MSTKATVAGERRMRPTRVPLGLAMLVGLGLAGCPAGASLDTPYEQYAPLPQGAVNTATTSSSGGCTDATVNEGALNFWCSSSSCHGTPESDKVGGPLWLFSPTRMTDFLDVRAVTEPCTDELIVDTTTPLNSLLIRATNHTSPCGLEMPDTLDVKPEAMACIEEWVLSMVATAAGVGAEPGVGGTSAF